MLSTPEALLQHYAAQPIVASPEDDLHLRLGRGRGLQPVPRVVPSSPSTSPGAATGAAMATMVLPPVNPQLDSGLGQ